MKQLANFSQICQNTYSSQQKLRNHNKSLNKSKKGHQKSVFSLHDSRQESTERVHKSGKKAASYKSAASKYQTNANRLQSSNYSQSPSSRIIKSPSLKKHNLSKIQKSNTKVHLLSSIITQSSDRPLPEGAPLQAKKKSKCVLVEKGSSTKRKGETESGRKQLKKEMELKQKNMLLSQLMSQKVIRSNFNGRKSPSPGAERKDS